MPVLEWDKSGERLYETGTNKGVLYMPINGVYSEGFAWNGLTAVTESPTGAEATPVYADNIKYLNLVSAEDYEATIEALTYPLRFQECLGEVSVSPGVSVGQQNRKTFGFSYQTRIGNDLLASDYGYKIHLVYGALAAPSEKAYATINETPEATPLSWAVTTTPVPVPGLKPSATLTIDSTKVSSTALAALEAILYGTAGTTARLPLPEEVFALFAGTITTVTPTQPTFVAGTGVITIPTITGVQYRRADTNQVVTGTVTIAAAGQTLIIRANPTPGNQFPATVDDDWAYTRT